MADLYLFEGKEDDRTKGLHRLQREVTRLRGAIQRVNQEAGRLLQTELTRPLTAEEAARVRALRLESEGLRWELGALRQEFDALRARPPGRAQG